MVDAARPIKEPVSCRFRWPKNEVACGRDDYIRHMRPVLFHIGDTPVMAYGAMLFLALVVGAGYMAREAHRHGWDPYHAILMVWLAGAVGVAGAKTYGIVNAWDAFVVDPVAVLVDRGGLTFYGGFVPAVLTVAAYARWRGWNVWRLLDTASVIVPLSYAITKVGCLLNGDDYGPPSDLPWAMAFPQGAPPTTVAVHPAQIYESLAGVAIFAVLWWQKDRPRPRGFLAALMFLLMGVERFVVEFWRTNPDVAAGLTMAQWISIGLVSVAAVVLLRMPRRRVIPVGG